VRGCHRSFGELLVRSLAISGLLYAAVLVYAVPAMLLAEEPGLPTSHGPAGAGAGSQHPTWRPSYAERFPGCVAMARWDGPGVPATVVVLRRDGALREMPFEAAFRRATSGNAADDVWTVGACRWPSRVPRTSPGGSLAVR
jgi:hypothetical protein